ncbi:hypothetical protein Pmani_015828 [Petrolisthes manimaculis]|uniref:DEUBAD domain-containing protein n=1 Tax=Petrolisthes manimaculis TaxID=1843537 RepID=A0AAE1PTQ0_9EUCA|nr:hypothetical protein Pmani_015828 [Petrolisthes manimaculis]
MEKLVYNGVSVDIPWDITEDIGLLLDIISPDTWNNHLTDEHRHMLMGFLPEFPHNDLEEKKRTLEMFFMDQNFRHGSPLRLFHHQLCNGHFNTQINKMRTIHNKILYREYRYRQKQYFHRTLEETLVRRKRVLDIVTHMPPDDIPKIPRLPTLHNKRKSSRISIEYCTKKRYFRELAAIRTEADDNSELSSDEIYPEGPGASLNKKQRRQLGGLEGSLPGDLLPVRATHSSGSLTLDLELKITPTSNPLDLTDDHFRSMLTQHRQRRNKRETSVVLDTRGITLQDVITRAQTQMKRPPLRPNPSSPIITNNNNNNNNNNKPKPKKKKKKKVEVKKEEGEEEQQQAQQTMILAGTHTHTHTSAAAAAATLELLPAFKVKVEPVSESDSESSSSSSSSVSDGDDPMMDIKKELVTHTPVHTNTNTKTRVSGGVGITAGKNTRIKTEPVLPTEPNPLSTLPPPPPDDHVGGSDGGVGSIGGGGLMVGEVVVDEKKVKLEIKDEPNALMEDHQVTAAIETSSELTAALESIGACIAPELTQETHICFFSLVRDIIGSTSEQRMTRAQLESSIRVWQESAISPLNEWYGLTPSWVAILPSAINFLCGHFADVQPADFVPYIEYKSGLGVYQWIGAGRDSDGHLEPLAQFWLCNKSSMSSEWIEEDGGSVGGKGGDGDDSDIIPPPRCYTSWTVQPATDTEKEAYRTHEKLRYEKPHKAYTFMTHGYESVVGPVKGIYTQQTGLNKARGHSLLVPDRPAYVTILSLVRDAVARLPNGEGTRSDICELLKESQYLAPLPNTTAENNLNSVVSGALDRLHYENDPCVKYDTPRKLWIYLHRNRSEEEFERMHHLNGPGGSKVKKPAPRRQSRAKTKEPLAVKVPTHTPIDTLPSPTKTDGGGGGVASVRLKAEEVSLGSGNTATKTNKQSDASNVNTTVKLDHLTAVGGVRGASSVQTIQVSTAAGGVQTIKVALPPGTQTLAKVTPHQLAKVASQAVSRGGGSGAVKGTVAMKGTHIQTAVGGANITPDTLLNTQHITALTQGGVVVSGGGGSGNKTRSPIVTLTTREAARLTPHSPTPTTTTTTTPSPTTHHHHHHHHTHSSGSSVGVGKLTTTQQQQALPTTHKSTTTSLFSLAVEYD